MKRAALVAAGLLLGGVSGVASLQPGLAKTAHDVKEGGDVYPFPPPAELHLATLGWDAAVVDQLWAKLLVEYGTHWAEHREYLEVPQYADAMLELEPGYRPIYKYIDTMLAYRPLQGTEADVRTARAFLERGTRERPDDGDLWMNYGSFIAFIAPSFLKDQAEIDRWRADGAAAMGHAIELGADADRALTVASILSRGGTNQAAINYLERAYAFTEHPSMTAVHEAIGKRLVQLQAQGSLVEADEIGQRINARWQQELPFVSRDEYILLGPVVDVARCAGVASASDEACSRDWTAERP
ncbi:MAG TPA: hypothetical protein VIF09_21370 [Polyangiaceae bacterium]|jgi:hypothetical protein